VLPKYKCYRQQKKYYQTKTNKPKQATNTTSKTKLPKICTKEPQQLAKKTNYPKHGHFRQFKSVSSGTLHKI
jgi:hypothetical protein